MFKKSIYLLLLLVLTLIVDVANGQASVKVNFQSRTLGSGEVPEGYLPDYGDVFGDRGNGYSYGWSVDKAASSRDRDSIHSPDQRYDSHNSLNMWNTGLGSWEIELPDATYDVYIVGGDPDYFDSTQSYIVEGIEVLDETPYPPGNPTTPDIDRFDECTVTVSVNDGRLTIDPVIGVGYIKICFVHIVDIRVALPVSPENESIQMGTSVTLEWLAGLDAIEHDVYIGEDFNDVSEATTDTADIYKGRQSEEFYPATGTLELEPGKTYYWRIDEFDGTNVIKGGISSFTIQVVTAFNPEPVDGGLFVDPNTSLNWSKGAGATNHFIYFGDNPDSVRDATMDSPEFMASQGADATSWNPPGTLQLNKTYYWRVDEQESEDIVHKGEVWSFTVAPRTNVGLKGQYYDSSDLAGDPVLTRIDPEINFDWGLETPDPNITNVDSFSMRWTGQLEIPASGQWTFWANMDDTFRLWVNGQLLIDESPGIVSWYSGTITLEAGLYPLVLEFHDTGNVALVRLLWQGPLIPERQVIPAGALQPPMWAMTKNPMNGAVGVDQIPTLHWVAGDKAVEHDVYFGTDYDEVTNADTTTPGVYRGRQELSNTSYTPPEAPFEWSQTLYWRVDEINDTEVWKGAAWSFTVADFLSVDDFEDYNDFEPDRIFDTWVDGYGTTTNGSTVGYADPDFAAGEHFVETTIVHTGSQSMPYFFDNDMKYSEAVLALESGRDWTREGVEVLSLWFRGIPSSVGSFTEDPAGTFTMTSIGTDIWDTSDEFHFAYKQLTGIGSITAQVLNVENTDPWAKAGVMIRNTLDSGSSHAMMVVTPAQGVSFQRRISSGGTSSDTTEATIRAPQWVRIERDISGNFTASYSADGISWTQLGSDTINMDTTVYIGLALTSHNNDETCEATFSNVTMTGEVSQEPWMDMDIGILSNDAEQIYVVLDDNAVIYNEDPAASLVTEWTEWRIDLQEFADQGVDLTNVSSIGIGFGERNNPQAGGSGLVYFDDIRLYKPSEPEPQQ
jgi:hypothetical protein